MSPISRRNDSTLLKRAAKLHSSVLKDSDENLKKQVRKKKKRASSQTFPDLIIHIRPTN